MNILNFQVLNVFGETITRLFPNGIETTCLGIVCPKSKFKLQHTLHMIIKAEFEEILQIHTISY